MRIGSAWTALRLSSLSSRMVARPASTSEEDRGVSMVKALPRRESTTEGGVPGGWHPCFVLPALPYRESALSPAISARALRVHYHQLHETCVARASRLAIDRDLKELPLEEIVRRTAGDPLRVALFRYAAEAWNHSFYWQSLRSGGGGRPYGAIAEHI